MMYNSEKFVVMIANCKWKLDTFHKCLIDLFVKKSSKLERFLIVIKGLRSLYIISLYSRV